MEKQLLIQLLILSVLGYGGICIILFYAVRNGSLVNLVSDSLSGHGKTHEPKVSQLDPQVLALEYYANFAITLPDPKEGKEERPEAIPLEELENEQDTQVGEDGRDLSEDDNPDERVGEEVPY